MAKILVADDERSICQAFVEFLRAEGHEPLVAANGAEAVDIVTRTNPELLFLDIQMAGMDGLQALKLIHQQAPQLPVIVMTAYGTMHTAIEAMRLGAFDYLTKPVDLIQIRQLMQRALQPVQAVAPRDTEQSGSATSPTMISKSTAMQEVFKLMGLLTTNDYTVLLTGESGVGKELVARAIHFNSERKKSPFIAVNCAAIPENLIESELFGHEKGAFTGSEGRHIGRFEAAAGGTLFLDEIGELPYHLQSKLLRVLQERSFERVGSATPIALSARIITATNRNLEREISSGQFREDLYYRLKLITLEIPPLRQRREDIEPLAYHFLTQANRELQRNVSHIETEALTLLHSLPWPGNVRELEHTIKRAVLVAKGSHLKLADLGITPPPVEHSQADTQTFLKLTQAIREALHQLIRQTQLTQTDENGEGLFHKLVAQIEQDVIEEALKITHGNQVTAAKLLGLHRTTLRNKQRPPG